MGIFYNVHCLQSLFLENKFITVDAQMKNTIYTFQLKSFQQKMRCFFRFFSEKVKNHMSP